MPVRNDIDKPELMRLIKAYDGYIQRANDEDLYRSGWRPVCLDEFYDCEFQELEQRTWSVDLGVAWSHGDDHGNWEVLNYVVTTGPEATEAEILHEAEVLFRKDEHGDYGGVWLYSYEAVD